MADGAGLTKATTAFHGDFYVELVSHFHIFQRLTHDHACHFTAKVLVQRTVVDGDVAATLGDEHPGGGGLAATRTVILSNCHNQLPG